MFIVSLAIAVKTLHMQLGLFLVLIHFDLVKQIV